MGMPGIPEILIILVILFLLLVPVAIGIGMIFVLKNRSTASQRRDCPGCGTSVALCLNACPHCESKLPS